MDKVYPVCARLNEQQVCRVVAVFEDLNSAFRYTNMINDDKPLYWDDLYYYVDNPVPVYPKGISLFSILKENEKALQVSDA